MSSADKINSLIESFKLSQNDEDKKIILENLCSVLNRAGYNRGEKAYNVFCSQKFFEDFNKYNNPDGEDETQIVAKFSGNIQNIKSNDNYTHHIFEFHDNRLIDLSMLHVDTSNPDYTEISAQIIYDFGALSRVQYAVKNGFHPSIDIKEREDYVDVTMKRLHLNMGEWVWGIEGMHNFVENNAERIMEGEEVYWVFAKKVLIEQWDRFIELLHHTMSDPDCPVPLMVSQIQAFTPDAFIVEDGVIVRI
jgi:hypothetical protein